MNGPTQWSVFLVSLVKTFVPLVVKYSDHKGHQGIDKEHKVHGVARDRVKHLVKS